MLKYLSKAANAVSGSPKYLEIFKDTLLHSGQLFRTLRTTSKLDDMSGDEIRNYQFQRLQRIIDHAYMNIPYYRESFDRCGFKPGDFDKLEDIKHLPTLSKDQIRQNFERLVPVDMPRKHLKSCTTGGSTGKPLTFHLDRRTSSHVDFAYQLHLWRRIGYRFRDRCVVMRGDFFKSSDTKFWRMNHPMNWLILSTLGLNGASMDDYLQKIRRFDPEFLIIYPSVACIFAKQVKASKVPLGKSLRGVICSSESLYEWQRKFIGESLNVPVYSYYGLTEKCCLASGFVDSSDYEFIPTYCLMELIGKNGAECETDGDIGEIVATGLNSLHVPLIRYRTSDLGLLTTDASRARPGWKRIKEIMGRVSELIVHSDGSLRPFTFSDEIFWKAKDKIDAYQFTQDSPGKLRVSLKALEDLDNSDFSMLRNAAVDYYPGFDFEFEVVQEIQKSPIGKTRYLIQNIPLEFGHTS